MSRTALVASAVLTMALLPVARGLPAGQANVPRRNVLIFVADGLRAGSVNARDTPALWALRARGVEFRNSHATFPTLTMPNASVIATGRRLGTTGVFGNTPWIGYPSFDTGNFNHAPGSPVPFIENDQLLSDLQDHASGLLGGTSFLGLARQHGYNTAAVGKIGPVALQSVSDVAPAGGEFPFPSLDATLIIDDATGTSSGVPLPRSVVTDLKAQSLPIESPSRSNGYGATSPYNNGYGGDNTHAGTLSPNTLQQQWFADVATRVILPRFEMDAGRPFALVFWSRDPDGTQHNQGDGLGTLYPGINGDTSRQAVRNADRNLAQLIAWVDSRPSLAANTDIVVTSDHGFATISRREIERSGRPTASPAAKHPYLDASGAVETASGVLPYGFLAIDLALDLRLNLYDPDRRILDGGRAPYKLMRLGPDAWEHPASGNGFLGSLVRTLDGSDAQIIVAANGGSDLIFVPDGNAERVRTVVSALLTYDYVGGVFVDDKFGQVPGTLPLSAIGLEGGGPLPSPAIVVAFKVFYLNPDDLQTAVQLADTTLQEGQGVHGGLGRDSTYNTMVAAGPDFKRAFVDLAPVGNADIVPTLAHILGFGLAADGRGRVAREALSGAVDAAPPDTKSVLSPAHDGWRTVLFFQEAAGIRYPHAACFLKTGDAPPPPPAACR